MVIDFLLKYSPFLIIKILSAMSRAFRDLIVSWEIINVLFFVTAYMYGEKRSISLIMKKKHYIGEKILIKAVKYDSCSLPM